jgi:2-dehydropantoate 2-reductase
MGNTDIIAEFVPPVQILAGTTSHGATLLEPGHIRHAGLGSTTIGAWADSKQGLEQAQKYSKFFNKAGIETEAVEDVRRIVWNKLLINVGINAITALTAIKNGQILDLEVTKELSCAAVREAINVARAKDIDVLENAVDQVFKIAEATAANRSSMGQDVDNKRQTEISAINGYISNEAQRLGIDAPVNRTLTALVETLQYHY